MRAGPGGTRPRRRGVTVVETLLVLAVLAIAGKVGGHLASEWWLQREAAEIVEAIREVDRAARQAGASGGEATLAGAPLGEVPEGLAVALPPDFAFRRAAFTLGWNYWPLGEELAPLIQGEGVGSVTVHVPDPDLQAAFLRLALPSLLYRAEDRFTFVVAGL